MGETTTNSQEFKSKFAEFVHKYIQDSIVRADQKCTIFFTFILFTFLYIFDRLKLPISEIKSDPYILVFFLLVIILLAISIIFSFLTIFPKLGGSSDNLIYWESILVSNNKEAYYEKLNNKPFEELLKLKIINCYELSLICRQKYRNLKRSIFFAVCGVVSFMFLQLYLIIFK